MFCRISRVACNEEIRRHHKNPFDPNIFVIRKQISLAIGRGGIDLRCEYKYSSSVTKKIVEKNKEANDALGKQDAMKDAERSMTAEGTVAISQWKEEIGT